MNHDNNGNETTSKKTVKRRIIRRRQGTSGNNDNKQNTGIPETLTKNPDLIKAITALPQAYEFEILKTLWRIQQQVQSKESASSQTSASSPAEDEKEKHANITHVALQMPEGLLMYACTIGDIIKRFCLTVQTVSVMGDVTYGACCVDDLGAKALGADLLVHYGHSCLVPVTHTVIPCLYVFVEIQIDVLHLVNCFCESLSLGTHVEVMGTVQFRSAVSQASKLLNERNYPARVPQAKPLSPGEVLGCTAPSNLANANIELNDDTTNDDGNNVNGNHNKKVMLFIADGRFHLEAAMISNPTLPAYRYDPYAKKLTLESYETDKMKQIRYSNIQKAKSAQTFGIILGTLGRQGNPAILSHVRQILRSSHKKYFVLLLSEIVPQKLRLISKNINAWVQIACPRLSVDWGHFFERPILTPYELEVCLDLQNWREVYPMDFYSSGKTNLVSKRDKNAKKTAGVGCTSVGRWSNYHDDNKTRQLSDVMR